MRCGTRCGHWEAWGHTKPSEVWVGRWGEHGAAAAKRHARGHAGRVRLWARARGWRAHQEHAVHVRDAGRVEAQRLVEPFRFLYAEPKGGHATRGEVLLAARREAGWGSGGASARGTHGDGLTEGWGAGRARRAHVEHATHVRHAGRVEAQRLVELFRVLPSERRLYDAGRVSGRGAGRVSGGHVGQRWRKRHAREREPD